MEKIELIVYWLVGYMVLQFVIVPIIAYVIHSIIELHGHITICRLERKRKQYEKETERLLLEYRKKKEMLKSLTEDFHQN